MLGSKSPAEKRYNQRVLGCCVVYGIALIAAAQLSKTPFFTGPVAVAAALLPALAIVGIFAAIGRYLVEEQDEYLRMLMIRQTLWASGFALSIATIWGFLESFELVEHVKSYAVAILWFGGLGLGALANRLTSGRGA